MESSENSICVEYESTPDFIEGTLRSYQLEGLNWFLEMYNSGTNCILADEMGLGKTIQTISFITHQVTQKFKPHLLVVPKSILINWEREFHKFAPSVKVFKFHALKDDFDKELKKFKKMRFDVLLTTYEFLLRHKKYFKRLKYNILVVDEAHRLKNENSLITQVGRTIDCDFKILLTGTPLQNSIRELWSLLNFLQPDNFKRYEDFEKEGESNEDMIARLRHILNMYFLRREKVVVEKDLPPKKIINLYPPLTELQKKWYKNIIRGDLSALKSTSTRLSNLIMQLRKICCHPYLIHGIEEEPFVTGEHLIFNSNKLSLLDKIIEENPDRKILVFSQFTMVLDILEDYLGFRRHKYERIDGSVETEERAERIDRFMYGESKIFILSTRAGGVGLNLTAASLVVFYDCDWNPQMDNQAMDRAHRIGQTQPVLVYRMISRGTVEERMLFQSLKKLKLGDIMKSNSKSELLNMIIDNDYEIEGPESLKDLIKEGEEKTKNLNNQLSNTDLLRREDIKYELDGEKIDQFISRNELFDAPTESRKRVFYNRYKDFQFYSEELVDLENKQHLTDAELQRISDLRSEVFDWSRREFLIFIKILENEGENMEILQSRLTRSKEEIENYLAAFKKNIHRLEDGERIEQLIEKGKAKRERDNLGNKLIQQFLEKNKRISDLQLRSKVFSEHIDQFILNFYNEYRTNNEIFKRLKYELKKEYPCDYHLQTIKIGELQKRLNVLMQAIIKEESK